MIETPIRQAFFEAFERYFEEGMAPHITFDEGRYMSAYTYSGVVANEALERYYIFKTEKPMTLDEAKLAARRVAHKMAYHFGGSKKEKLDLVTAKVAAGGIDGEEEQL